MIDQQCRPHEPHLSLLLYGDEASAEYRSLSAHLETCHACQHRLTDLAADPPSWTTVREVLSERDAAGLADEAGGIDRLLPDVLAPPSHPEMLGRIGRYEVEKVIGAGGMGVVLKGFDSELNRPVAIKVLARHLAHSGAAKQRFAREAPAAAAVVHEHVVAIHNVETDSDQPYLVMQYVCGESLQSRVDREGPLSPKEILRIGIQAAAGLEAAHEQGVVHRDVKPGNILLEQGVERALISDFGLARTVDDASLTHTGVVTGTPDYMAPEQARGEPSDDRSDLFSLGAVLYFMATGHPPFRAERAIAVLGRICNDRHRPLWQVNAEVPDELSDVIDRLLEKKPHKRLTSATDVKQALTRTLARLQQRGAPRRRLYRRLPGKSWMLAGGLLAALAVAATVYWTGPWNQPQPPADIDTPVAAVAPAEQPVNAPAALAGKDWASELQRIDNELSRLEAASESSRYFSAPGDGWNREVAAIRQWLERAESTRISNSPATWSSGPGWDEELSNLRTTLERASGKSFLNE